MIEVRPADSDADLEAFIRIRRALLPNESAGTVAIMREDLATNPHLRYYVSELEGEVVGSGLITLSDLRDRYTVKVRVLPDSRRRGVGTALLRELVRHAKGDKLATHLEEASARPFAERFGFEEIDRQVEQVKRLGDDAAPPALPDGIEVVSIAERPSLLREAYPLACQGYEDMAVDGPAYISLDVWLRDEATLAEGSFVALDGEEIVGYSGLVRHDNDAVAEDGLTVVRRDWRHRGLATALKRIELAWATKHGLREIVTWTQLRNDGMRRVNELLGYEYRDVSITMLAPLPLKGLE